MINKLAVAERYITISSESTSEKDLFIVSFSGYVLLVRHALGNALWLVYVNIRLFQLRGA